MKLLTTSLLAMLMLSACTQPMDDLIYTEDARRNSQQPIEQSMQVRVLDQEAEVTVNEYIADYFPEEGVLVELFDESNAFILVELTVVNTASTRFELNPAAFTLADADGAVFEQTEQITDLHEEGLLEVASVPIDDSVSGLLAFSIPKTALDGELFLEFSGFTDTQTDYSLQLQ